MELSDNARLVLENRYLHKENGRPAETPEEMFRRVAHAVAEVDSRGYGASSAETAALEEEFYAAMTGFEFLPNSPTLMNAGRELGQLSACFVLPIEDSLESIFDTLKTAALIHQSGGGTGFSFSRLRPRNDAVRTTGGVASGPVSFIRVYDAATNSVKQGGMRRGANMGILRVDHPDILEFIRSKENNDQINNFNLSVAVTDAFMKALENDEDYELINPRNGEVVESLSAQEVFDLIADMAWKNGEPGIVFIDRLNADNPTPQVGAIESTNPCGEQPLLPYESCNLGSINLGRMIADKDVDYAKLAITVKLAVRFLDNVIDANRYPLPKIRENTLANRKIGLGVMGWADMLISLGIPYDSQEALELAGKVMSFIQDTSMEASAELAEKRGPFPNFPGSIYDKPGGRPLRNATTTTIAPTGTISIIAGASSGIEPLFSVAFTRHVMDGRDLCEVHPLFGDMARREGFYSRELIDRVASQGSLEGLDEVPESFRRLFVTAHEIEPEWHVRMQAAFQAWTHNAVSKTVNCPRETSPDDIRRIYRLAFEHGCKGVTVYRDASRQEQVLTSGTAAPAGEPETPAGVQKWGEIRPIPRPDCLQGSTEVMETPGGKLFLTLNLADGHPLEMFAQIGKAGSDVGAFTEAVARLISLALRSGVAPDEVAGQLLGIGGSRSIGFGPNRVLSVPDAIGRFLKRFLEGGEDMPGNGSRSSDQSYVRFNLCPSCGTGSLVHVEGCAKCLSCGHSEC